MDWKLGAHQKCNTTIQMITVMQQQEIENVQIFVFCTSEFPNNSREYHSSHIIYLCFFFFFLDLYFELFSLSSNFNIPKCLLFKANQMWDETPSTSLEQYPETSSSEQRPQKHLVLSTLLHTVASKILVMHKCSEISNGI